MRPPFVTPRCSKYDLSRLLTWRRLPRGSLSSPSPPWRSISRSCSTAVDDVRAPRREGAGRRGESADRERAAITVLESRRGPRPTKTPRPSPRRSRSTVRAGSRRLGDVGCLRPLLALHDLELHAIAFSQGFESVPLDGAEVNEDVGATLAGDEPIALGVVEPLHGAGKTSHCTYLLRKL